jgi:hypothetical protein
LERGEIVSTRGRDNKGEQRYNASKGDITNGLPIVVLINGLIVLLISGKSKQVHLNVNI